MHQPAVQDGAKDAARSANGRFSRLVVIFRKLLKISIFALGALGLVFAVSAFFYNRYVHYETKLVAWPPPSEFIAPVEWKHNNPDRVRILSIDGGGLDGIITLEVLKYFEEQSGRPASELFDFVSGTSTGAIITVGLLLTDEDRRPRYSADELISAYVNLADKMLDAPLYHKLLTLNGVLGPRLLSHARIVTSHDMFGDAKFGQLRRPALVPVFSRDISGLEVFRNWTEAGANLFVAPLIAAATSAPTYFPAVQLEGHNKRAGLYADAVLIADNPAQLAFLHALKQYPDGDFVVVSLGTKHKTNISLHGGVRGGVLDWLYPILSMVANGQKDFSTSALDMLQSTEMPYDLQSFRIAPEIPWAGSQFDSSKGNISRLRQVARDYIADHRAELDKILDVLKDETVRAKKPDQ